MRVGAFGVRLLHGSDLCPQALELLIEVFLVRQQHGEFLVPLLEVRRQALELFLCLFRHGDSLRQHLGIKC